MTAAPAHRVFRAVPSSRGEVKHKPKVVSFAYDGAGKTHRRRWFASLMWRTFPGASMREKALRAAPVLDLTPRQCENLMKMEHDAKLGAILAVLAIAGAESIFEIIRGTP